MTLDFGRLIAPPVQEEIYPYRRVWRSIIIETTILVLVVVVLFGLTFVTTLQFDTILFGLSLQQILAIGLAVLPALLWIVISYRQELRVLQPRAHILIVFIITALTANAIGIPLQEWLSPATWLSQESTIGRLIGYTVTLGVVHEFIKYIVVRYTVWRDHYRIRQDSLAYCAASAMAYATIINLHFVTTNDMMSLDMIAMRVLFYTTTQLAGSMIVSYGLAEASIRNSIPVTLPVFFLLGTVLSGGMIAFRTTIFNASLGITLAVARPLFSLAFTILLLYGTMTLVGFLYRVEDRRDIDRYASHE
jgi:hypothetical protein